jgi:hypothetical protein
MVLKMIWYPCFQYSGHLPLVTIMTLSFFSKMFYEIEEHIGKDLRTVLHTKYFQILDILCLWTALLISNDMFPIGFIKFRDDHCKM